MRKEKLKCIAACIASCKSTIIQPISRHVHLVDPESGAVMNCRYYFRAHLARFRYSELCQEIGQSNLSFNSIITY